MGSRPVRIGIVAGEASGDQLGAGLIPRLREHFPDAVFQGIGGERMIDLGFDSLYPLERLAIMGLIEPLKRLPELLRIRRALYRHFCQHHFDLVIGIDAPDFNLGLELKLRKQGIATAHYVSPSVWAWRQGRIKKIARAVDHMLTLFPFESAFYQQHGVPVTCVGHPLADDFPLQPDVDTAREELGLGEGRVLTIMPGSRGSEVAMMAPLFLQVGERLCRQVPGLQLLMPAANADRREQLATLLADFPGLPVRLLDGQSHRAMTAADAVLLTSGTTSLEAMLLKKPMTVAYKMGGFSYWLLKKLVKTDFIALPNLVAGRGLVPEFLQDAATVDNLETSVLRQLVDDAHRQSVVTDFVDLHQHLRRDASATAARALATLIEARSR